MAAQTAWAGVSRHVRKKLRDLVFERDGYRCRIENEGCTGDAAELDHIIPRSVDPSRMLDPANLRASCQNCNRRRGNNVVGEPSREW